MARDATVRFPLALGNAPSWRFGATPHIHPKLDFPFGTAQHSWSQNTNSLLPAFGRRLAWWSFEPRNSESVRVASPITTFGTSLSAESHRLLLTAQMPINMACATRRPPLGKSAHQQCPLSPSPGNGARPKADLLAGSDSSTWGRQSLHGRPSRHSRFARNCVQPVWCGRAGGGHSRLRLPGNISPCRRTTAWVVEYGQPHCNT